MNRYGVGAFIVFIIIVIIAVTIWGVTSVSHGKCPFCDGQMEYEGTAILDGDTVYRYRCTKNTLHYLDFYFPIN